MITLLITMRIDENAIMDEYRKEQLKADGRYSVKEFIQKNHLKVSPKTFRRKFHEWCIERGIKPVVNTTNYLNYLIESFGLNPEMSEKVMVEYLKLKNIFTYIELNNSDEETKMSIASVVVARVLEKKLDDVIYKFIPIMKQPSSIAVITVRKYTANVLNTIRTVEA